MRWPLVSRLAYDAVVSERDRLRVVNDGLTDHLARLARVEHGLPERKTEPKKIVPMPPEIREKLLRWGPASQRSQEVGATKMHAELVAGGVDPFEAWRRVGAQLDRMEQP